ncbi:hypothetical protein CsSME_00037188 [Camellia sinensis var. sinensis]
MTVSSPCVGEGQGRVLIIGASGFIGEFIAQASLDSGRTTFLLVRSPDKGAIPSKSKTINSLHDKGAILIHQGVIEDQEFVEGILKDHKIDIVISAVGGANILNQLTIVKAIKAVGTIKRFLPSEFGHDVDRANPVEPGLAMYKEKRMVRRLIEESGVPYTYICCNSIASWPYYDNTHPSEVIPPLDRFQIYGDGTVKENIIPQSIVASFTHDIFIKGCQVNFSIDDPNEVEVSNLYPDETFRTMDECFDDFVMKMDRWN